MATEGLNKKSPNDLLQKVAHETFPRKWQSSTIQKLPKNVGNLGKQIIDTGFIK